MADLARGKTEVLRSAQTTRDRDPRTSAGLGMGAPATACDLIGNASEKEQILEAAWSLLRPLIDAFDKERNLSRNRIASLADWRVTLHPKIALERQTCTDIRACSRNSISSR